MRATAEAELCSNPVRPRVVTDTWINWMDPEAEDASRGRVGHQGGAQGEAETRQPGRVQVPRGAS